jgi:polyhydroxyalkanoate synthesis regulator phasin
MDEPALNSLIKQRVEEAVTNVQTDMLKHMDRIITNRFDTFQKSVKENQRELSETDLAKIEEMNSDNYVFKRKETKSSSKSIPRLLTK